MTPEQTRDSLYDLLRAVVAKVGGEIVLTREEFDAAQNRPLSISLDAFAGIERPEHPEERVYLRCWYQPRES